MAAEQEPQGAETLDEMLEAAEVARREAEDFEGRAHEFQIIRFRCGDREFAVTIDAVERTERIPMITPVPRSPGFIKGVANLRGGIVCVLDLRSLIEAHQAPTGNARSLLVLSDGMRRVGILSDSLPDFQRVVGSETMSVPASELEIYTGAIERDSHLIGILDPAKLFDLIEQRLHG